MIHLDLYTRMNLPRRILYAFGLIAEVFFFFVTVPIAVAHKILWRKAIATAVGATIFHIPNIFSIFLVLLYFIVVSFLTWMIIELIKDDW